MIRHFIIMSYAYPEYKRIAFDIIEKDGSIQYIEYIDHIISNIREKCNGDAPFSTHSIPADDENWESVVKADPYFRDVAVIDDFDEFMAKIIESRKLKGTDVGNYIINKITPLTHLQLQKLCYFCYADYLCETKKKLFNDNIYAFRLGPVIETVYNSFKGNGSQPLHPESNKGNLFKKGQDLTSENDEENLLEEGSKLNKLPSEIRILFSKDGIEKLKSINKTLDKYGKCSASELVAMTHRENTPWDKADDNKPFAEISDENILKYHRYEEI